MGPSPWGHKESDTTERLTRSLFHFQVGFMAQAPHSSTLAWKIPWTEEPDRLHTVHRVTKSWTRLKRLDTFTVL